MFIANVVLVDIQSERLETLLKQHGYGVIHAADIALVAEIDTPFALSIINQDMMADFGRKDAERLYFMNNSAPVAVLISDPADISENLINVVRNGTLDLVYTHEVASGLICNRIDKIFIGAQFNKNLQTHQKDYYEKEVLKKELSLREQILKHERLVNANIIGSITSGLAIIDPRGTVILMNQYLQQMLYSTESDVIGGNYEVALPKEIANIARDILARLDAGELPHVMKKVKIGGLYLDISAYRMMDFQNNPTGLLILVHDITEQEATSVQLYRAEKLATVGTMLSGIAHELRNPLAIISARAQRSREKHMDDPARILKGFESIEMQAQRCAEIVNGLLDFTRHTATKGGYHKVADVLDETLNYVSYQNVFDSIQIERTYTPDLVVFGDRSRYVQVFLNIIMNAADAMNGRGTLTIDTKSDKSSFTLINISDTGDGIQANISESVFDPFFTTKDPGKGTGLGLAIVFKIVQQSGGTIKFSSVPGRTTFSIRLPAVKERVYEQAHSVG